MMKFAQIFATFALLLSSYPAMACMPHSPDDVFIGRLHSVTPKKNPTNEPSFTLTFSNHKFVFRSWTSWFRYSKPTQWQSHFKLNSIKNNDLVIGLAYYPDGAKPSEYQISTLATLTCENNRIKVGKPLSPFVAWNRKTNSCNHGEPLGLLDGFFEHDQNYYIQQLQKKYPTCDKLNHAF